MENNVFETAKKLVYGNRNKDYGSFKQNMEDIASIASILCGKKITSKDIPLIMIAVKLARESYKHKRDNIVDMVGYAEILDTLYERK